MRKTTQAIKRDVTKRTTYIRIYVKKKQIQHFTSKGRSRTSRAISRWSKGKYYDILQQPDHITTTIFVSGNQKKNNSSFQPEVFSNES